MPSRSRCRALWVALAAAVIAAGCSAEVGAPESATEQGDHVLDLWRVLLALSVALGLLVIGLIAWSVVRYRSRPGDDALPAQHGGHMVVEAISVGVPLLIVAGLFVYILHIEDLTSASSDDPDVVVEVTGYRWGWRFHYPAEGITVTGGPGDDPELVLPVDRTARLELATTDVIHSFFVPRFLTKLDLIPDEANDIDVRPTRTGTFTGHCAEFCGLDHARMNFAVRVTDDEGYQAWVDDQGGDG